MYINDLTPGVRAYIDSIDASGVDERRLREHGLDQGVEVELLHRAAFGADPIAVRVGNACIAMRRAQAASVRVRLTEFADAPKEAAE
jgi:ferrous iron transport protein A|tara:strand:- start:172137 stop:172397 length:261 start_codon:yes stop_codon:yes gene_type:complete